jgi:hypothetical protein
MSLACFAISVRGDTSIETFAGVNGEAILAKCEWSFVNKFPSGFADASVAAALLASRRY